MTAPLGAVLTRISNDQRYFRSELCSTRVQRAPTEPELRRRPGSISAQRILIPGLVPERGRSVRQRAPRSLKSATPKGASCNPQTNGDTCIWVNSRLRVEILSCQVCVCTQSLRPLRQSYWLTYCSEAGESAFWVMQGYPRLRSSLRSRS